MSAAQRSKKVTLTELEVRALTAWLCNSHMLAALARHILEQRRRRMPDPKYQQLLEILIDGAPAK